MAILDGRALSFKIKKELEPEVKKLLVKPKLLIIVCEPNDVTRIYLEQKKRFGEDIGVEVSIIEVPCWFSEKSFKGLVKFYGKDESNNGIIIQLPLPRRFDTDEILEEIPYEKDVDTLTGARLGAVLKGRSSILPPIVAGVRRLFEEYEIDISGKDITVIGAGKLVGRPFEVWLLSLWLFSQGMPPRICPVTDAVGNVDRDTRLADIIISGAGVPKLIRSIKKGAIVIDCGTAKRDGKYKGDVDPEVYDIAGFYTPVPGGVGPLTVAFLFWNLIKLIKDK